MSPRSHKPCRNVRHHTACDGSRPVHKIIHRVPKKEATKLLAITFSNLNRFSKFFHCWKDDEFTTKPHNIFHHTLTMFSHYIRKFSSSNLLQITTEKLKASRIWQKMKRLCCHNGWMEIGVVFSTACSRCLPDSPKPDSPKLGLGVRVRVRVSVSANWVSAKRDWTMLEVSAVRLHACTKTFVPLVNALSVMLWSTFRHSYCKRCFSSSVSCTRDWYTRTRCWTTLQIL